MTASELAANFRRCYGLSQTPTGPELVAACAAAGLVVVRSAEITSAGYYVSGPVPLAIIRPDAGRLVVGHELAHHLTEQGEVVRGFGGNAKTEAFCRAFAEALCGSD